MYAQLVQVFRVLSTNHEFRLALIEELVQPLLVSKAIG